MILLSVKFIMMKGICDAFGQLFVCGIIDTNGSDAERHACILKQLTELLMHNALEEARITKAKQKHQSTTRKDGAAQTSESSLEQYSTGCFFFLVHFNRLLDKCMSA